MKLQKGRPENTDNRLNKEIRVYDFLDKPWRQHHDLQKSFPVQSSGDGFLSSSDAWR